MSSILTSSVVKKSIIQQLKEHLAVICLRGCELTPMPEEERLDLVEEGLWPMTFMINPEYVKLFQGSENSIIESLETYFRDFLSHNGVMGNNGEPTEVVVTPFQDSSGYCQIDIVAQKEALKIFLKRIKEEKTEIEKSAGRDKGS